MLNYPGIILIIIKYKDSLIKLGLVIEEFDNNAIIIREHPAILDKVNFSILIKDIAEEIIDFGSEFVLSESLDNIFKIWHVILASGLVDYF